MVGFGLDKKETSREFMKKTDTGALAEYGSLLKKAAEDERERRSVTAPYKIERIDIREKTTDLTPISVSAGLDEDLG